MRIRKLFGLGIFLVVGAGCGGFFATDDNCLTLGCPVGGVCVEWEEGKARCEKAPSPQEAEPEPECRDGYDLALEVLGRRLPGGALLLGERVQVCAELQLPSVPLQCVQPELLGMDIGNLQRGHREEQLTWKPVAGATASRICQEAWLPLSWERGDTQIAVSVRMAGSSTPLRQSLTVLLTRTACSFAASGLGDNAVTQPLVVSGSRLLFGTSPGNDSHLHVFDTSSCTLAGSLHTGAVQGPMVALGDTGYVAVATNGTGTGVRRTPRLTLVNAQGAPPDFDALSSNADASDCVQLTASTTFDRGLSLLSLGDENTPRSRSWRLVAPANNTTQPRLVAYAPFETTGTGSTAINARCTRSATTVLYPFLIPTAQRANGSVVGVFGNTAASYVSVWEWTSTLVYSSSTAQAMTLGSSSVMVIAGENEDILINDVNQNPMAVDSLSRVYFVHLNMDSNSYRLERMSTPTVPRSVSDVSFQKAPVGSPLLGEASADNAAEVYVVTTAGEVLAFEAESLRHVWTEPLGFDISPTAQPVLVAHADGSGTLWVVGMRGEIRGIRVGNHGLNRRAQWPKAFRDNCNTSSRMSNPNVLLGCF